VDGAVGGTQGAEPIHGRGDGVGDFVLVPHRAPAGGPPHDVYSELCDPGAIVVARGFVAAEGEAGGIPAVEPECGGSQPVGVVEQGLVEGHVDPPAAAHGVHQEVLHFTASAYASTGGHTHTRLRSPYAPSTRPTDGHTLWRRVDGDGNAARSREYGRSQRSLITSSSVWGALRRRLVS